MKNSATKLTQIKVAGLSLRAVICNTCYGTLSMFDGTLMLQVNLPMVDTIHLKGNKFVTVVKIKVTVDSKLNIPE